MQGLGGGAVPPTSHSVSAPTRWIRKHGPGLATSTGAIKVPDDRSRHSTNALLAAAIVQR
jgi:hypothetical protein